MFHFTCDRSLTECSSAVTYIPFACGRPGSRWHRDACAIAPILDATWPNLTWSRHLWPWSFSPATQQLCHVRSSQSSAYLI